MTYIYAGLAALCLLIGGFFTHLYENVRYQKAQEAFTAYKEKVAEQEAANEKTAREALQKQIDDSHRIAQDNDRELQDLHAKLDEANRLRDQSRSAVRSLLADAAKGAGSCAVPAPPDKPGVAAAGRPPSLDEVADACGSVATEDKANADRLDALIQQIKPQL